MKTSNYAKVTSVRPHKHDIATQLAVLRITINNLQIALEAFLEIEESTKGKGLLDFSPSQLIDAYELAHRALDASRLAVCD